MSDARGFIVALSAFLAVLVSVSSAVAHREEGVSAAASVKVVDLTRSIAAATPGGSADFIYRISCRGQFCMLLAGGVAVPFDAKFGKATYAFGSYSAVHSLVRGPEAELSCSSAAACMVTSQDGQTARWNGSRWIKEPRIPGGDGPNRIACAAATRCFVIHQDGGSGQAQIATFNGLSWSEAAFNNDGQVLINIQCANSTYCLILGNDGDVWTWAGRRWSAARGVTVSDEQSQTDPIEWISCAPGPLCMGVGTTGGGVALDRGHGFAGTSLPALRGGPACGTASFCLVSELTSGPEVPATFDGVRIKPAPAAAAALHGPVLACGAHLCLNSPNLGDKVTIYRAS